jgi:hypothetical protein
MYKGKGISGKGTSANYNTERKGSMKCVKEGVLVS